MPAQERSISIDRRVHDGDQPHRQYREAMARNTSPKGSNPRAEAQIPHWDDAAGWDQENDEAARSRARRLLSRRSSGFDRVVTGLQGCGDGWPANAGSSAWASRSQ